MTFLWTGDSIEQYRHEKEQEKRRKFLEVEAIFAEKDLKAKLMNASEEERRQIEEEKRHTSLIKRLEEKKNNYKKQHKSPLSGLEA